jgi:hypothetical protein
MKGRMSMANRGWKTSTPGKFIFNMDELAGEKFREYCEQHHLFLGRVLEELVINYLVEKEVLYSRESLQIERDMSR